MEHIIVKQLANGYVQLTAESGYVLYSVALDRIFSEAVVKASEANQFKAIAVDTPAPKKSRSKKQSA